MKVNCFASFFALLLFLNTTSPAFTQSDSVTNQSVYQPLTGDLNRLIEQAGNKKIVALGGGTHGTKEFNELRTILTQKLIKEHGFNYVLFESNYGGAYAMNNDLKNASVDVAKSMKQHLVAIWQTKEIQELLKWTASYNKQATVPINLGGIDYAEISETFRLVKTLLSSYSFTNKDKMLDELQQYVSDQDAIWNNLNKRNYKFDRKTWINNGEKAYELIGNLEVQVDKQNSVNAVLGTALLNLKLGFETIHLFTTQKKDASRDSCMAEMIKAIRRQDPEAKVIVWAHNVHIANKPVYDGNNGGGMGAYLRKAFSQDYFSVGTFTATGTFSATTDQMPTRFNVFTAVNLQTPIDGSLEQMLGQGNKVILTKTDNALPDKIKLRFIGYGPQSGPDTFTDTEPRLLYDAIIYLEKTSAAEHLPDEQPKI